MPTRSASALRNQFRRVPFRVRILAAALAVAVTSLAACGGGDDDDVIQKTLEFVGISYPTADVDKRTVLASTTAKVSGKDYAIGFNTLLRSGQQAGSGTFGLLYNSSGNPIIATDGSQRISDDNDHSTLLDVQGKVFMVSQFESRPGGFYITELNQNASTGQLTPIETKPIDFSALGGGWVHCAGSRSPWKTHLGSEEYEPDARLVNAITGVKTLQDGSTVDTYYGAMGDYYGGDMTKVNPYRYGFTIEVAVNSPSMGGSTFASNVSVTKHYAMGRVAQELTYVMPDGKTAYITDDGAMVGLFMFKADIAQNLSSGKLYAAKFTQTAAENGGSFTVSWIDLGHATSSEIQRYIDMGVTFGDLFTAATPTLTGGVYTCPAGTTGVSHGHDRQAGSTYNECLALNTSNAKNMTAAQIELAASRLETRRYAALKGATTELNKEEGITYDPDNKKLYIAMSDVTNGMRDNTTGAASTTEAFNGNHVKVAENRCGGVYEMDVDPTTFEATTMKGLLLGKATTYDASSPYAGNTCHVDGIANPDNLTYVAGYNVLIVGEDTGSGHQNDLIWAYDLKAKKLTRIQTTPYGAETTSPYFYPNVNGWGYLMSVVQHPYGESDTTKVDAGSAERRAYTGYVGPFPKMD